MTRIAALTSLLQAFTPADAREAAFHRRMLDLAASPADPLDRRHFHPGHFTASAFVLGPDATRLLLIFHGKLRRWLQPGGHIDPHDRDVVAAARREVAEEVGLADLTSAHAGIFDIDIHPIPAKGHEPGHEHFDVRFLFRSDSWEVRAGSDAHDARWVEWRSITAAESDESVLRAMGKLRTRSD